MVSMDDPYFILLRDLCNGGIKESYPKNVSQDMEKIMNFFVEKRVAEKKDFGYIPTNIGKSYFMQLNMEINPGQAKNEQIWYSAMENVLLS